MDNGVGFGFLHIGQSTFSLPTSYYPLILRNLLHVPYITKNLVSVSQFPRDNHVYFEFHFFVYFVKDLEMSQILLRTMLKNDLYNSTCLAQNISSVHQSQLQSLPFLFLLSPCLHVKLLLLQFLT